MYDEIEVVKVGAGERNDGLNSGERWVHDDDDDDDDGDGDGDGDDGAEVGAGERKAKIEGLNTGDRWVLDEIMD